jgi:hypothetical protein
VQIMSKLATDWSEIRQALKHRGAVLVSDGAHYSLSVPIDPQIAQQILCHPAVVLADESDGYLTFQWRPRSVLEEVLSNRRGQ